MIRVGRCAPAKGGYDIPSYESFEPIIVMMKSHSPWYPLSPYELKNKKGQIMENIWQFSKVYKEVPKSIQYKSRYDRTVIWNHHEEVHVLEDGTVTDEYYQWREKGMNCKWPVRYPVGYNYRHSCLFSLDNNGQQYDYIEARKKIYAPVYIKLAKRQAKFQELKQRLVRGEDLLIVEIDGPHQDSLSYYQEKYEVG